jgi:hypothetical protein
MSLDLCKPKDYRKAPVQPAAKDAVCPACFEGMCCDCIGPGCYCDCQLLEKCPKCGEKGVAVGAYCHMVEEKTA